MVRELGRPRLVLQTVNVNLAPAIQHRDFFLKTLWNKLNAAVDKISSFLPSPLLLASRLYWGWQFFQTGKGKLLNLDKTAGFFAELGIPLPKIQAGLAGTAECVGGLFLLAGLFSRLTCVPLIFTMIVAYLTAHRETVTGIFSEPDAFVTAPPFLFLFVAVLVFVFGPGAFAVDRWMQKPAQESL